MGYCMFKVYVTTELGEGFYGASATREGAEKLADSLRGDVVYTEGRAYDVISVRIVEV